MSKHVSAIVVAAILAAAPSALAQVNVNVDITPEEQAYQSRTDARIRAWIHEDNHDATEEERTFVNDHWKRTARLWRIRRLAEQAHDTATVARVDAILGRADNVLEVQLGRMRVHAPILTVAPGTIEVQAPPPPDQIEMQGAPPSPRHLWVKGYYRWNGQRHVWNPGRWAEPPQPGMVYDPARWENRGGRYVFIDGRWRIGAPPAPTVVYEPPPPPTQVVEVEAPPPPPIVEVRPPPPPRGVWIPGFWHWNGARHVWIAGHWSAQRVGMRWEPDHWVRTPHGYRLEHGHWVR